MRRRVRSGTGAFAGACRALARAHVRLFGPLNGRRRAKGDDELARALELSGLSMSPDDVRRASMMAGILVASVLGCVAATGVILLGLADSLPLIAGACACPLIAVEAVRNYPVAASRKLASEVVRDSTASVNLMMMSLRREPSLPAAMAFASSRGDRFSAELRACTWGVVMGRFSSFEQALQDLGERWSGHCAELKTALNALITASCEGTEDGRRRALDRASSACTLGVRRRIEDYALSLSTPSMIMFGLTILMPLMVGSLLPMLSWNVWTTPAVLGPQMDAGGTNTVQIVFIMNFLFPAVGLLVALSSISRHPLESGGSAISLGSQNAKRTALSATAATGICILLALASPEPMYRPAGLLLALTVPLSVSLAVAGRRRSSRAPERAPEEGLFRTGARMVEGENFESACFRTGREQTEQAGGGTTLHMLGASDTGERRSLRNGHPAQVMEAFGVVRKAASKDERSAGLLAMDLAAYLRDLRETEKGLRSRLKPTISMMSITSYVLAPVVLGITYAMYLTLGGIAGSSVASLDAGPFFLVLGLFLGESNAVVQYFIWGIEGRMQNRSLALSIGSCVLVSELLYTATATLAS